jgi:hypothetical protein
MKRVILLILIAIILTGFVACAQTSEVADSEDGVPQINPLSEAASRDNVLVNLYYGYKTEQLLVGESREINVPVNERIEVTLISNLIQGASTSKADFSSVINPDTKIVNITDNDGYLFVTLSKEFLLPPDDTATQDIDENIRRYLAAYSVVDTLIEKTGYYRVQILIDRDDSGAGTPITNGEIGLPGNDPTEPLGWEGSIILNSRNTMREIMTSIQRKDWNRLYSFISYKDTQGDARPTLDDFKNEVSGERIVLSNSEVIDHISSTDLYTDYVLANFTIKLGDNEPRTMTYMPIYLVRENDLWKIPYDIFKSCFFDTGV